MNLFRRIAEAAWDEATARAARHGTTHPRLTASLVLAAERAQRPRQQRWFADGPVRLTFRGNDRQLFATFARVLGATSCAPLADCDVAAREIPWWSAPAALREGALVCPRWVGLEVDCAGGRLDERRRASMRKAVARGLTMEVVPAAEGLAEFFERFYAPTARARHGGSAFVRRKRFFERVAARAEVLFVREPADSGVRLAGALLVRRAREPTIDAWVTGVRDGDYERVDGVVRDALHVFCLRHARAAGASVLGLTAAPPFLGDGLLRYKRSLGAHAVPIPTSPIALRIDVRRPTDAVRAAFARSPPIVVANGALRSVTLVTSPFHLEGVDGPEVVPDLADWARRVGRAR